MTDSSHKNSLPEKESHTPKIETPKIESHQIKEELNPPGTHKFPINPAPVSPFSPSVTPTPTPLTQLTHSTELPNSPPLTEHIFTGQSKIKETKLKETKLPSINQSINQERLLDLTLYITMNTWLGIHEILKRHGMDSQQALKALAELRVLFSNNV